MATLDLESVLDLVEPLQGAEPARLETEVGEATEEAAAEVLMMLQEPQMRSEHRGRIYEDLLKNRELLLTIRDPRLIQLLYWSEHVENLYRALSSGRLRLFYYVRALEATCKRAGFDLLPVMDRMEDLGKVWAARKYEQVWEMFQPRPKEVQPQAEAPREE